MSLLQWYQFCRVTVEVLQAQVAATIVRVVDFSASPGVLRKGLLGDCYVQPYIISQRQF